VGNVVFIIWGTAKAQPWDADDYLKPKDAESACEKTKTTAEEVAPPIDPVLEQQISWPERYTAKAIDWFVAEMAALPLPTQNNCFC